MAAKEAPRILGSSHRPAGRKGTARHHCFWAFKNFAMLCKQALLKAQGRWFIPRDEMHSQLRRICNHKRWEWKNKQLHEKGKLDIPSKIIFTSQVRNSQGKIYFTILLLQCHYSLTEKRGRWLCFCLRGLVSNRLFEIMLDGEPRKHITVQYLQETRETSCTLH